MKTNRLFIFSFFILFSAALFSKGLFAAIPKNTPETVLKERSKIFREMREKAWKRKIEGIRPKPLPTAPLPVRTIDKKKSSQVQTAQKAPAVPVARKPYILAGFLFILSAVLFAVGLVVKKRRSESEN